MMTCRDTARLISHRLDRPLSGFEWLLLWAHLLGCGPCRHFGRAVRWLHHALASLDADADVALSAEARERMRLALERAARSE
jgi:hypothetical protein